MNSPETINSPFSRPEALSRPEAMRHEIGPLMTLASMYVLQKAEEHLDRNPITMPDNVDKDQLLFPAISKVIVRLAALSERHSYAIPDNFLEDDLGSPSRIAKRLMRHTYYGNNANETNPLGRHLIDGFRPQLKFTKHLLIPGYARVAYPDQNPNSLPTSHALDILESPDFQKLLIITTKTANGLWREGSNPASPLLDHHQEFIDTVNALHTALYGPSRLPYEWIPIHPIDASNLCVRNNQGQITMSPYARQFIAAYLKFSNIQQGEADSSIGCPVSVRKGNFPFEYISPETLVHYFGGEIQEDGTIIVPNIMTINPEGKYTYANPAPAILGTNSLLIKVLRDLYERTF